jgi:hypothetical protein
MLLEALMQIEAGFGRERSFRNARGCWIWTSCCIRIPCWTTRNCYCRIRACTSAPLSWYRWQKSPRPAGGEHGQAAAIAAHWIAVVCKLA